MKPRRFFALPEITDGIYRLGCGERTLDLLFQGMAEDPGQSAGTMLVNFGGAVTNRETASGPFFSGVSLAKTLGLPLMAIADPVVSYEPAVGLAWYAGAAGQVDVPQRMARIIDHIARIKGMRPVLFGGSGGGFAVLNVMQHMKSTALGFIWNPQTQVSNYPAEFVHAYVAAAFPAAYAAGFPNGMGDAPGGQNLAAFLDQLGLAQSVRTVALPVTAALLYVQNISDWHVASHLKPLMAHGTWVSGSDHSPAICHDRRIVVATGDWGQGHVAPPSDHIGQILAQIARLPMDDAVFDGLAQAAAVLPAYGQLQITAKAVLQDGRITISTDQTGHPGDTTYAFYLLEDGMRKEVIWYTPSPDAAFTTEVQDPARLGVRVFARRGQADPVWKVIKVVAG